jgi:hypothetical protein
MRITAYGFITSVSLLLASETLPDFPLVNSTLLLQGGALAVLAWTIWHLLTRTLPAHERALKEQRESFLRFLSEERHRRN